MDSEISTLIHYTRVNQEMSVIDSALVGFSRLSSLLDSTNKLRRIETLLTHNFIVSQNYSIR